MLRGVHQVILYVNDQEEAKNFWVDKIGCTLAEDSPYGEERWLSVLTPDGAMKLVLSKRQPGWQAGVIRDELPHSNVFFYSDDIEKTHRELTERGVEFPEPPTKQFYGWWSMFADQDGTRYALSEKGQPGEEG